jgi:hypothetical protein
MMEYKRDRCGEKTMHLLVAVLLLVSLAACGEDDSIHAAGALDVALAASASDAFDVRLEDDPGAGEMTLVIGPVDVPAGGAEHGHGHDHHGILPDPKTIRIPKNIHITGFRYDVIDADGNEMPRGVLHHMNIIDPGRRELFLPISQRMLAIGKETGAQSVPRWLIGSPIREGTEPVVTVMLHNPTQRDLKGVRVLLTLEYRESGGLTPIISGFPFQVDVAFPAGDKQFDLPPGRSSFTWEGSPSLEGRILALGSHLHEHAEEIRFEDVTTGEVIWTGYPVEDDDGELTGVTTGHLYWSLGKKIYPDRTYRVTVVYNNPTQDTLYGGGMGVVAGIFRPSDTGTWPAADTSDPLYQIDRRHYLRQVSGTYEEIAGAAGEEASHGSHGMHGAHEMHGEHETHGAHEMHGEHEMQGEHETHGSH